MIEHRLRAYFSAFNGTRTWEELEPQFNDIFHDDLTVVTASGEIDRNGWIGAVKKLLEDGVVAKIDSIRWTGDAYFYSATLTRRDGSVMQPISKCYVKDNKVVRVVPMNAIEYTNIAGTVSSY